MTNLTKEAIARRQGELLEVMTEAASAFAEAQAGIAHGYHPRWSPEDLKGDLNNYGRAEAAQTAVEAFIEACPTDDEDAVADFLCDLMHLCSHNRDRWGDFAEALRRAAHNYEAETTGRGPLGGKS